MAASESGSSLLAERLFGILIVDYDPAECARMERDLQCHERRIWTARDGLEAVRTIEHEQVDLVFLDSDMAVPDGVETLRRMKREDKNVTVIMMTGYGTIPGAVNAVKNGAEEYIAKPVSAQKAESLVRRVEEQKRARLIVSAEQQDIEVDRPSSPLITANSAMMRTMDMVERMAPLPSTVLIEGESGTGKELIARNLHDLSPRANQRFVAFNCAAIPENLLESELFGHERGAFTGAEARKIGYFEAASGGTIFLDEIAEMSIDLQVKLLRVIQERTFRRVGSVTEIPADVRILAATNQNLDRAVSEGRFRKDLYYRINVVKIRVPPLRERPEDIPLLSQYFVDRYAARFGKPVVGFDLAVLERFQSYPWEGNVRELQNVIERSVAMANDREIHLEDLPERFFRNEFDPQANGKRFKPYQDAKSDFEIEYLRRAMARSDGNITMASRLAGISRQNFYEKLSRYGIEQARFRRNQPEGVA